MAVEYVTATAFTIIAALTFGQAVGPAVENYRAALHAENAEARQLIQDLSTVCTQ